MVALPEIFHCPYSFALFDAYTQQDTEDICALMSAWARQNAIWLIGGSILERSEGKLYNTCFCFDPMGRMVAKHRKVHLFDVNIPGEIVYQESAYFSTGRDVTVFDTEYCRVGVAICFDMRFPMLIRELALRGAELIVVPAQFNQVTGPRHWETIIKSRALDNQVFFAAAACATDPDSPYKAYGHSAIASPDGQILAMAGQDEALITYQVDPGQVKQARESLPTFAFDHISWGILR